MRSRGPKALGAMAPMGSGAEAPGSGGASVRRYRTKRPGPPARLFPGERGTAAAGQGRGGLVAYYASAGPKSGPILWRDHYGALGVLEAPGRYPPIGTAMGGGPGPGGVHLFKLTVHGRELPGKWIVVGDEFWPAEEPTQESGCAPRR